MYRKPLCQNLFSVLARIRTALYYLAKNSYGFFYGASNKITQYRQFLNFWYKKCILLDRKTPDPLFQIVSLNKNTRKCLFLRLLGVYLPFMLNVYFDWTSICENTKVLFICKLYCICGPVY